MRERDPEYFFRCTRMTPQIFDMLLQRINHRLQKYSIRQPIKPACRLFLTLMYLAHGSSIFEISRLFRMGVTTVREITQEVSQVLWFELHGTFMPEVTEAKWKQYSDEFEVKWNLPHCCAAVDGKHISIHCPPNSGSLYFNYKKQHSIVLMAMCDANYNFVAVDVGAYGGNADSSVFSSSEFGSRLLQGRLGLPQAASLVDGPLMPYFIVGDAAFPLKTNLMRPYPGRNLPPLQEHFNYRLSRARRVIENAFGILVSRWRILLSPLFLHPESADNLVKATLVLHNFVKSTNEPQYNPPGYVDQIGHRGEIIVPGEWRSTTEPLNSVGNSIIQRGNNAARSAYETRDTLAQYLFENNIFL
nr:protein ALP1-like [Aedes albopictus]